MGDGMRIDPNTMDRALSAFHDRYVVNARRAWDIDHHVRLWAEAQTAFANCNAGGFGKVYGELRSHWQIARGKGAIMASPDEVFKLLCDLPTSLRQIRLTDLNESAAPDLRVVVAAMESVKQSKGGESSIMAISKVLHFLNPRLFVIVDRGMVWNWALNHLWVWRPIEATREALRPLLPGMCETSKTGACDPLSYVAILVWAGRLLRDNPAVSESFARFLRSKCSNGPLPPDLATYDAVAVEWLLLGMVELPPPGVDVA
jgi:hypothetical protein